MKAPFEHPYFPLVPAPFARTCHVDVYKLHIRQHAATKKYKLPAEMLATPTDLPNFCLPTLMEPRTTNHLWDKVKDGYDWESHLTECFGYDKHGFGTWFLSQEHRVDVFTLLEYECPVFYYVPGFVLFLASLIASTEEVRGTVDLCVFREKAMNNHIRNKFPLSAFINALNADDLTCAVEIVIDNLTKTQE